MSLDRSLQFAGRDTCSKALSVAQSNWKLDQLTATLVTPQPPATNDWCKPTNGASHKISVNRRISHSEVITLEELATYLRISKSTVYRCVRLKQLPAFRVGRQWRVNLELVQNHLIESYERKTGHREDPY